MGVLVTVELLCQVHHIQEGSIEVSLDGEGAYKSVFESTHASVDSKAHDLIRAIKGLLSELPVTVTGRHIEGTKMTRGLMFIWIAGSA